MNVEASKDRPSPLAASSRGCLVNLCGLCLRLCRPILRDASKIGRIDWLALFTDPDLSDIRTAIFPSDSTKLIAAESSAATPAAAAVPVPDSNPPATAVAGAGAGSQKKKTKELNFITQSFFICWRALHLGERPVIAYASV